MYAAVLTRKIGAAVWAGAMMCGCASTSVLETENDVYREFIQACQDNRPDDASKYLMNPNQIPCDGGVKYLDAQVEFVRTVSVGAVPFTDSGSGYRLNDSSLFEAESLNMLLQRIKVAIKTGNADLFFSLLSAHLRERYPAESMAEALQTRPELNALYAAIAGSSPDVIWMSSGKTMQCTLSGRSIVFAIEDGHWKLDDF